MRVVKAEEMGICIGIKRAFAMVEDVWRNNGGRPLFVYGDIAHNQHVIDTIREHGFKTIYSASEAPKGSIVVIRAHGISDEERRILDERGVVIVDATCPLVKKNQDLMRSSELDVLLLGIKGHSETVAVEGAARRKYYVIQDAGDLDCVPNDRKYRVIVQTTLESSRYGMLVDELDRRGFSYIVSNSICMASEKRREAVHLMKGRVPFLYVIGDRKSANSNALVSEALSIGLPSSLIEDQDSIDEDFIRQFDLVGISAGSSTPDSVINKVVRRLEEL